MREFMNIIDLSESVIRGKRANIVVNPGFEQLKTLVLKTPYREMRGIVDRQNTYFWDAALGTHAEIADEIGVNRRDVGVSGFFFVTGSDAPHADAAPAIAEHDGISLCITPYIATLFEDTPSMESLLDAFGYFDD